jgi:hypothetical protein
MRWCSQGHGRRTAPDRRRDVKKATPDAIGGRNVAKPKRAVSEIRRGIDGGDDIS